MEIIKGNWGNLTFHGFIFQKKFPRFYKENLKNLARQKRGYIDPEIIVSSIAGGFVQLCKALGRFLFF